MNSNQIKTRTYGTSGPVAFILHGGPAAVGQVAPIARGLARQFRIIEPFQRSSGHKQLTVERHINDLDNLIRSRKELNRPIIIGHSWGAMLSLAYASSYPENVTALVLIGCGTFNTESRDRMNEIIAERLDEETREQLKCLKNDYPDPGERLKIKYELIGKVHDFCPDENDEDDSLIEPFDIKAHTETWNDMIRLQEDGIYPAKFSMIKIPVLMLHGSYDPHPGKMIYDSLKPYIENLQYYELEKCGHYPWKEKFAKDQFFKIMIDWMIDQIK